MDSHPLARDEIIRSITVFSGWTTAAGAAGGTTLVDSKLVGVNDYVTNKLILIMSGDCKWEVQRCSSFATLTGTITTAAFSAQIVAGVSYKILTSGFAGADIADLISDVADLLTAVLELTETGGTLTADGTEQNVYINNAPAALYRPVAVQIDCTNMAAGDTIVLRTYYRIKSGGNLIKQDEVTLNDAQDPDLKTITLLPNRYGIKVTLEQTAGVNRDYDYETLYEA